MIASINVSADGLDYNHNTSSNNTFLQDFCAAKGVSVGEKQVTVMIHVLALLVALVGNTLLITAIIRMRETMMLFIANMAASDLVVAIFLIPRLITREVTGSNAFLLHGSGGTFLCKMCTFLSDMSLAVSTQSLVLIAVERFLAVVYPMLYKKITLKIRRVAIAYSWILAAAYHAPYFYTMRLVNYPNTKYNDTSIQLCQPNWEPAFDNDSAQFCYNMFLFTIVLLVPLCIISVLSIIVICRLRKDKMAESRSERGVRRNRERIRNLQRMAAVTVTALLICWTPYIVFAFLDLFSLRPVSKCNKSLKVVRNISRVLATSYCAVNPCICLLFLRNVSRELRAMCKRNFCKM